MTATATPTRDVLIGGEHIRAEASGIEDPVEYFVLDSPTSPMMAAAADALSARQRMASS